MEGYEMRKGGIIRYEGEFLIFEGKECWEMQNKTIDHVIFKKETGEQVIFTHKEYEKIINKLRKVQANRDND
jgi:hypothetical protein